MRHIAVVALALVHSVPAAYACFQQPTDGFALIPLERVDLIARGIVHTVEDVVCARDVGGGVPIDHNCVARLVVEPTYAYNGTPLPAADIALDMPFFTNGYSVAAGDAPARVAAGREREIVFMAVGPAQGPGFDRPRYRVLADGCLHSSVRPANDRTIHDMVAAGRLRATDGQDLDRILPGARPPDSGGTEGLY